MKFRDVILKYYKMVYHISLEYLRRKEDAEDIVQEVFFKYAKYINEEKKTFEDELHEKYWIIRITINSCCNYLKDPKRKKDLEDKKDVIMKDNLLFDEIQKLEDMYKSVFILHYLEDFKTNDIGAILEVSEETVKTRLKRARECLKDGLKIEE